MQRALPLSRFQSNIWKGQKVRPDAPLYNMVFTFDIHGEIDVDRFGQAWSILVDNTTILKLVADESDPEAISQMIGGEQSQIEYIDITTRPNFDLQQWLDQHHVRDFDLTQQSYYTALIKISEGHYIWYFNQHHLFTDAYCFQVLYERLSEIYSQLESGADHVTISDDGDDYIRNFEAVDGDQSREDALSHAFRQKSFSLYGAQFRDPSVTSSTRTLFDLESTTVDAILAKLGELKLRTFSANLDLLAFLMSNLVITLSKVSDNHEVINLSNIFSKRYTKDSKQIARPLLDIRNSSVRLGDADTFKAIYEQIYSFLIMRDETDHKIDALPPVIVNFFDLNFGQFAGRNTTCKWHHCGHMDDHHYLRLHIHRYASSDDLQLAFDIKDGHGIEDLGQRFHQDFVLSIERLLEVNAELPLNQLCLLEEVELKQLQEEVATCTDVTLSDNLHIQYKILHALKTYEDQTALVYDGNEISYRVLRERVYSVVQSIQSKQYGDNPKVVVYLERSDNYLYAVLGSLLAGAVFVPVPIAFPIERLEYIIDNVDADLLIHADQDLGQQIAANVDSLQISKMTSQTVDRIDLSISDWDDEMYVLYTSGSTGKPKGVSIPYGAFSNYIDAITERYLDESIYHMPLFTSVGFDLTMTSVFLPLCTGGSIHIYGEDTGIDLSIQDVQLDTRINCFKCTPSHLRLIDDQGIRANVKSIIVGGENFPSDLAQRITEQANGPLAIYNEYGPTEATVGCIVHQYRSTTNGDRVAVQIGQPLNNYFAYVGNDVGTPLPRGTVGELYIGGIGLAKGYVNDPTQTLEKFKEGNAYISGRYYRSGDYARVNDDGQYEYLGRTDKQVKIAGVRIEIGEVESALLNHEAVEECVVVAHTSGKAVKEDYTYCGTCGLPSNYPNADFDDNNICGYCRSFESYEAKVDKYFKTEEDFKEIFEQTAVQSPEYDCIMLYSGGKDSTYALGKLAEMGLRVLAFTLDNGYIPNSAKDNITRVVRALGVDHMFGTSPAMNAIFVESLKTHCNVCNGCFKTIYNISLKVAFQKNIPYIVTGLSRGQFFETKLSEELFWKPMDDVKEIERTLFEARQAYHTVKDTVYDKVNGSFIEENNVLDKVRILDFYRYHDVTLKELYDYINNRLPWVRPDDTGRSTNCIINKLGIYIHKQEKGYSNYAFPYSWDVRTGHKTKEETIDEIEEYIDEQEVKQMISEIGYQETHHTAQLIAYYRGDQASPEELRASLRESLPYYMIPSKYVRLDQFPLTANGKIDTEQLKQTRASNKKVLIHPSNEIEEALLPIWQEVLEIEALSIDDDFFDIGGTSLEAIRIAARVEKTLNYKLSVNYVFEYPSVQALSQYIMDDMLAIIAAQSN